MYKILFLLFFTLNLPASSVVEIKNNFTQQLDFELEYFIDSTDKLTIQELEKQKFVSATNRTSLTSYDNTAWYRFQIHNTTEKSQMIYLHNQLAFLSENVSFFSTNNGKVVKSLHIDLVNPNVNRELYGTDAIYTIELEPNEIQTIYIKNYMPVTQLFYFTLHNKMFSKKSLIQTNTLITIILGMLLILAIYHFLIYLSTGYKEYVYYTLYLLSGFVFELLMSGVLANQFLLYFQISHNFIYSSALFVPIFLTLFSKTIFYTKTDFPKENFFLNSIVLLFSILFLISLFDLQLALIIGMIGYIYGFFILFITTYSIWKKGNKLAFIFLVANAIFALFALITDLYYSGIIPYNNFVYNSAGIGMLIEAILLAYIILHRLKILQENELYNLKELAHQNDIININKELEAKVAKEVKKSREKDKILFQQNKMISMGEMLENIAHQWRQPLSEVNASVLIIDNIIYEKYNNDEQIEHELSNIENLTSYMSQTIDSFRNFFDEKKEYSTFSLKQTIYNAVQIVEKTFNNNSIVVTTHSKKDYFYQGYENELQQVILVLLNNSKDAFLSKGIENPNIHINISPINDKYKILFCDNAGGIDNAIIDKIFDPYFTTKEKTQGTGLGLYISKIIIEENMKGQLTVQNIVDGTCFNIILKRENI